MSSILLSTTAELADQTGVGPRSRRGDPPWEIATLYPRQGEWSEAEYLDLQTNHFVEFSNGELDFLPMPNLTHQLLSQFLFKRLEACTSAGKLGVTLYAPYKVRLRRGQYREPDVLFLRSGRAIQEQFVEGADLVVEIVSPGAENRTRDLVNKRADYAAAGVPEYWIVDPEERRITVLTLDGSEYREHGVFGPGAQAASVLLEGFAVDVTECFAAADAASEDCSSD